MQDELRRQNADLQQQVAQRSHDLDTACPSPNGTNYERLYFVREPQMAMDAAMDPDDNGGGSAARNAYETFVQFLQEQLPPNAYGQAEGMLLHLIEKLGGEPGIARDGRRPRMATDALIRRRVAEGAQVPRAARHSGDRQTDEALPEYRERRCSGLAAVAESTVRNHVRGRKRQMGLERRETFVPQSYSWAQEAQVDWYEAALVWTCPGFVER